MARRWQVSSQQAISSRREMRRGATAPLSFVAILPEIPICAPEAALASPSPPSIKVEAAGAVLRVAPGTDADLLATEFRAIRASAA